MSKERGTFLPSDLYEFLRGTTPADKFQQVILLSVVDPEGWPHFAMLSPWELVAKSPCRILLLLYKSGRTTCNIRTNCKLTLAIINPTLSYYVFCFVHPLPALEEASGQALFELKVEQVLEDLVPTATILTGLTFEGFDPGIPTEDRERAFQMLLSL